MVHLAPRVAAQIVVVLGCGSSGRLFKDAMALGAQRSGARATVAWCALEALHALPAFELIELASVRLRYLAAPSPPMPMALHVGVIATRSLAGGRPPPGVPAHLAERMAACAAAERTFSLLLRTVDRNDPEYHAFARDCASRVVPLSVAEIPSALQAEASLPEPGSLRKTPFRHGSTFFSRPAFKRPEPPPPPSPLPQCDEELYTPEFLCAVDAKIDDLIEFENGRLNRRPKPLFAGLECLQPRLRSWFAAGGSLDTSGGPGNFMPLSQRAKYPTHWNLDWIQRELGDTTDQQLLDMWINGIDLMDDTPFLMGINGNLYSAFGLERPSSTAGAAAQAMADRVAAELATFHSPPPGKPQLYSEPIELRPRSDVSASGRHSRFPSCPFDAHPCGQVPKSGDDIRIIINLSSPENGGVTMGGEPVVSLNIRCGLHPPPGAEPETWRHPPEPKPSPADAAHNDAVLADVASEAGEVVLVISIDGWKMFHQFFYACGQLSKTGALVPLQRKVAELTADRKLGFSLALVMAMGAGPASRYCQRAMDHLVRAAYAVFGKLEAPFVASEHRAIREFLAARSDMHDAFGCMARLAAMLVFTDDGRAAVVGPPARAERFTYALYRTFGGGGAAMILADALKFLLAAHSLWCGVRSAPSLGLLWFDEVKRTKRLGAIAFALDNRLAEREYKKLISYIEYWAQTLNSQRYLVSPLWNPVRAPRSRGDSSMIALKAEERGKLKHWRSVMTNCPGTTMMRHVQGLGPPRGVVTEHVSLTDCRLDWVESDGGHEWRCGMGGVFYANLWGWVVPSEFSDVVTIPLGEFVATIGGLYVADVIVPDAKSTVSEIDASASVTTLVDKADSDRLRVAHEVFLESELFARKGDALAARHAWGDGNQAADAASREERERAEALVTALGHRPVWGSLPPPFFAYFHEVVRRIRALGLKPPKTHWFQRRRRAKRNDDPAEPGLAIKYMVLPKVDAARSWVGGRIAMARSPHKCDGAPSPPPKRQLVAPRCSPQSRLGLLGVVRRSPPRPAVAVDAGVQRCPSPPSARRSLKLVDVGRAGRSESAFAGSALRGSPLLTAVKDEASRAYGEPPVPRRPLPSAAPHERELPTRPLRARLDHLLAVTASVSSTNALGNVHLGRLRGVLSSYLGATHLAAPKSTLDGENSAWRLYWQPYCEYLGIEPVLSDMEAMSGNNSDMYAVYSAIVAGCLPWVMERMPPKAGSGRTHALPTSGLKVLGHVRRIHLKRYHLPHFVPLTLAVQVCDGLCKQYIVDHGPDALTPQRKEPLTNEIVRKILGLFRTGVVFGGRTVDMSHPGWASLAAMFATLAQTGFRKAEVCLAAGAAWTKAHISLANVSWLIGGVIVIFPTLEQLRNLKKGDYCLLRPPPSKADPLGLHWGASTIYLRFDPDELICAAKFIAWMEIARAVPAAQRADVPLFVNFSYGPWRAVPLTDMFKEVLLAAEVPQEHLRRYSMHSWRIYLACALLAAGASNGTIQAMLRWRSDEALKIYARINDVEYADQLAKASQANISSVRTTTLREEMLRQGLVEGQQHAAFYGAWLQQAARSNVTTALAQQIPVHSSDDLVRDLVGANSRLAALAGHPDDLADAPLDDD